MFKNSYETITEGNPLWNELSAPSSTLYSWDPNSTYIHEPPYFKNMTANPPGPREVKDAYCLLNFGDSVTTDHISPAGNIQKTSPAAKFLMDRGVDKENFNSYGSRRGNDEVMARGTFANIRIVNKLMKGEVGPKTVHIPTGEKLSVFDAASVSRMVTQLQLYIYISFIKSLTQITYTFRNTRLLDRIRSSWLVLNMEVVALGIGLQRVPCFW